jgi:starch-binding outer membrane protein, SusD/RagB family
MKRIIKTALFLTAFVSVGFSLNSCKDAIDIEQPGQLDEESLFTSVSNLNDFLLGSVYGNMETNNEIYLTAVLTDEVKPGSGSGGQEFQLHRYFIDPSEGLTSTIWLTHYRVINRVNRLLEGASKITPNTTAEQTQYNSIIAQARAIRAYSYVQLEAYFSTDMKNPNALGVILLKDVPLTDVKLPRSTNQEVYDFINGDLDFARNTLAYSDPTNASARFYVDKGFVNAVSARFNVYRGNITLAKQYAQDVISNSGLVLTPATPITGVNPNIPGNPTYNSGAFTNATPPVNQSNTWNVAFYGGTSTATGNGLVGSFNPYRNIWADQSRGEIIFSLNRLPTGVGFNIGTRWNTNQSTVSGVPMWFLGRNLFNLINVNGDIRRYTYIDPTSTIDPNYATSTAPINTDKLVIDKYPGKATASTRNDLKLFRLSEMYFILAECEVATNNLAGAQTLIQQVRVARNYNGTATTPTYTSVQVAYADILKERRVELALEGHRLIDLKRLASQAGVTMDRNATDDIVAVTNLSNGSYKYTLPIPLSETSANPNAQQNPGY